MHVALLILAAAWSHASKPGTTNAPPVVPSEHLRSRSPTPTRPEHALPSAPEFVPESWTPKPWGTVDPSGFVRRVPRGKVAPATETWLNPLVTPKPTSEWWENMVLSKSDIALSQTQAIALAIASPSPSPGLGPSPRPGPGPPGPGTGSGSGTGTGTGPGTGPGPGPSHSPFP
ncbi:hypothetical protein T492DRAFT_845737 [Pavlovales sp. CCMP2436]|nr:hypothetical protein T492DRAFT_845737 [Pavlovales sp. CCMP2436]